MKPDWCDEETWTKICGLSSTELDVLARYGRDGELFTEYTSDSDISALNVLSRNGLVRVKMAYYTGCGRYELTNAGELALRVI